MIILRLVVVIAFGIMLSNIANAQTRLIGHWPLQGSVDASSATPLTAQATAVTFGPDGPTRTLTQAAMFDGKSSVLEVAASKVLDLKDQPFSLTAWVHSPDTSVDVPGDIISQYDPHSRTGFHLGLYSHGGVTNSQANRRQLHFGIDQSRTEPAFVDHGQLGTAIYVFSLCVHDGRLYASTCHAGSDEAGHVFRFEGEDRWTDLGSPDKANSVSAMTAFNGSLYATCYNEGSVFRFDGKTWSLVGKIPNATQTYGFAVHDGGLFVSEWPQAHVFRHMGGTDWKDVGKLGDEREAMPLLVYNGKMFSGRVPADAILRIKWKRMLRLCAV